MRSSSRGPGAARRAGRRPGVPRAWLPLLVALALGAAGADVGPAGAGAPPPAPAAAAILPVPQEEVPRADAFVPTGRTVLYLTRDAPELRAAARTLGDDLRERYGLEPELRIGGPVPPGGVAIGTVDDDVLRERLEAGGIEAVHRPEGYALRVDAGGVTVAGADERGAFYGAQSLRQLLLEDGRGFRGTTVRDWPDLPWRVAMVYLDHRSDEVNGKLVPILAQHKYNALLVVSDYLHFDSAPELHHPAGASKAAARRLVETARAHLLEPVPLLETPGHAGWLFHDGRNRDLLPPGATEPYAYDPLQPRVYEVLFPILDELVELFDPAYVHIGHDEVRSVHPFPLGAEGRRLGFGGVFLESVRRLHGHLAERGVGTMMWQDTLLDPEVAPLLDRFPEDVVVTSWHYRPRRDYPALETLREAGFTVLGASWYDPDNIETLAQAAVRAGAAGMVQTRWTGYFGNREMFGGQYEQVYAYLTAASRFWNAAAEPPPNAPERFRVLWRGPVSEDAGRPVDLAPYANRSLAGEGGWLGIGPDYDLSALLQPGLRFDGLRFDLGPVLGLRGRHRRVEEDPLRLEVPLGARAASLAFLHTTGWSAPDGERVGRYVVHYEDGAQQQIPLLYGRNIATWTDVRPTSVDRVQPWQGTTRNGLEAGVTLYRWSNPRPEARIARLELVSDDTMANPMLLGLTVVD